MTSLGRGVAREEEGKSLGGLEGWCCYNSWSGIDPCNRRCLTFACQRLRDGWVLHLSFPPGWVEKTAQLEGTALHLSTSDGSCPARHSFTLIGFCLLRFDVGCWKQDGFLLWGGRGGLLAGFCSAKRAQLCVSLSVPGEWVQSASVGRNLSLRVRGL